jgi:hypothetical protein
MEKIIPTLQQLVRLYDFSPTNCKTHKLIHELVKYVHDLYGRSRVHYEGYFAMMAGHKLVYLLLFVEKL